MCSIPEVVSAFATIVQLVALFKSKATQENKKINKANFESYLTTHKYEYLLETVQHSDGLMQKIEDMINDNNEELKEQFAALQSSVNNIVDSMTSPSQSAARDIHNTQGNTTINYNQFDQRTKAEILNDKIGDNDEIINGLMEDQHKNILDAMQKYPNQDLIATQTSSGIGTNMEIENLNPKHLDDDLQRLANWGFIKRTDNGLQTGVIGMYQLRRKGEEYIRS